MRFALYYCPSPTSALWQFGSAVLGYDSARGKTVSHPTSPTVPPSRFALWSQTPRRYGFHATLKAPFHLRQDKSEQALMACAATLASNLAPIELGRLRVSTIGSFIALQPSEPMVEISELAAHCVEFLEPMRAPLSAVDRKRRLASGLSSRQRELLEQFGYPYVHDEFRFHMTLTGALDTDERPIGVGTLRELYQAVDEPVVLDAIAITRQNEPDGCFRIAGRWPLAGAMAKTDI